MLPLVTGDSSVRGPLRAAPAVPAAGRRRARRQHALRHRRAGYRQRALRTGQLIHPTYSPHHFRRMASTFGHR